MKNEELIELIKDLQKALSKALNNEVIREYEHLQVRAEEVVKKLTISFVGSNKVALQDKKITRFEVIDKMGRGYVNYNVHRITRILQDNDKTLKIFIE